MTKLGMKRTTPRLPLKRKTPLKAKKGINKISPKQRIRMTNLSKIEPPIDGKCEKCGKLPDFRGLAKHHIVFRSHKRDDARENLMWLCGKCHSSEHGIREME